ncbi:GNAT family N-acetyltransferase [Aquimarina sp. MMG016]|uniref:GNAT family N-acetyltransferase n=1 Tax=Aquimarina sp. MMG016 TaxID=2822690 RepID=UPI001B3A57FD|nr:GNAT family N-acetyltransferase [Aquimarina sp. MMG016]MBQ4820968.1 GNAT family N-acetyltransferase [Aquimarina sp. MMG016]
MNILNCSIDDTDDILALYEEARRLQILKNMVVWPVFEKSLVEKEIAAQRQWKIIVDDVIACNWAVAFEDKEIWGDRDKQDAIYIHRICTNPDLRGNRYINTIVEWAKNYAIQNGKHFIRLDTLGNNTKLIAHYTSAGFRFLGIHRLTETDNLPEHYQREPDCCLFELEITQG